MRVVVCCENPKLAMDIKVRAAIPGDYQDILQLQMQNLPSYLSPEVRLREGFVSIQHSIDMLAALNQPVAHTVANSKVEQNLLGYALSMAPVHRKVVPGLEPMFAQFDDLIWDGRAVREMRYTAMGQVCVAATARGRGVFRKLYAGWCEQQARQFELGLTEIEASNQRSLDAHAALGWRELARYRQGEHHWVIVGSALS